MLVGILEGACDQRLPASARFMELSLEAIMAGLVNTEMEVKRILTLSLGE